MPSSWDAHESEPPDMAPDTFGHPSVSRRATQGGTSALTALLGLALLIVPAGSSAATPPPQPAAQAETLSVPAAQVGWTTARRPRESQQGSPMLRINARTARAYVAFDLPDLDGRTVTSARLVTKVTQSTSTRGGVVVRRTSPDWNASTLTHESRPQAAKGRSNAALVRARDSAELAIPLRGASDLVEGPQLGLRLSYSQRATTTELVARGPAAPRLVLTFSEQPDEPSSPPDPDKPVYAHYFPPYPLSFDNRPADEDYYARNYLTVDGEGGKHAAYGGLLRDRPVPEVPDSGNWRLTNLVEEVQQAKAAGIDGFTLNLMSTSGLNWDASLNLMRAADQVGGFEIVPMVDVSASIGTQSPALVADRLAELYSFSSVARDDGDLLLSSFLAERQSVDWWRQVISGVEARSGRVSFTAVFLSASDSNMRAFAPISDGFGNWGVRTPSSVGNSPNYAARAHAMGKEWMQPVAFQDARPRSNVYAEASNTETGRISWTRAVKDDADSVQIVTWNDYSESTQVAPSASHGSVLLDISRYYIDWFKTGRAPAITRDHLYVTHRIHPWQARARSGINNMSPTLGGMSAPPQDTVEALVFLTAPAKVTVISGDQTRSADRPAGLSTITVPLRAGKVSAHVDRDGRRAITLDSPFVVTPAPFVLDFQYYAVGV